jgi:alkylation response protein AidB-like acyl-CoA dehydrogenase
MEQGIERLSSVNASEGRRLSMQEAILRARRLAPALRTRAETAERARAVPVETISDLESAGLLELTRPAMFGGAELGLSALVAVAAELAAACGSTAWVYSVFVGHDWMVAMFPEAAQREVFGLPGSRVSSVVHFGGAPPIRSAGGFRFIDGAGRLCSGVDHAAWVLLGATVAADASTPAEPRYFLVPRSEFEVVDDWHTAGLRGTGSKSIRLPDTFVPEYRSVSISELAQGRAPGLALHGSIVYRAPFPEVLILMLAGSPLGIARGALESHAAGLRAQFANFSDEQIAEQSAALLRIARASADVDAACAIIGSAASRVDADTDSQLLDRLARASLLRDYAYAAQLARGAVNALFEGGGSRALYDSSDLQRMWRDMNTACAHMGFSWDRTAPSFARALLGLAPGKFEARRGH